MFQQKTETACLKKDKTYFSLPTERPNSDLGMHTDWKWGNGNLHANGNQKKRGVSILTDKIDFKMKTVKETKKDST